jgi:two-component system, cell cycle sensor histidine kinase and response regulator CckA
MLTCAKIEKRKEELEMEANQYLEEKNPLSRINEEWKNIFDGLVDFLMVVDTDYRVVHINKAMARALNTVEEAVAGEKYWQVVYGQKDPVPDCPLMLVEKTLRAHEKELNDSRLGGTFLLTASLIIARGGRHQGYCITFKDLTNRNRAERKKRRKDKLEAISVLSGMIALDFNNLLTGIQGTTSLALAGLDQPSPVVEKLKRIEAYIEAGHELTKQLLGFSAGNSYEVQTTDINRLVTTSREAFIFGKNNIVGYEKLEKNLWFCEVDPGQIEQVLFHLYKNAWQAMPDGGELHTETENVVFDQNYADFFGVPEGPYVKVTVTDSGEGMDDATQETAFEPFFTTRPKGAGLGLAFAHQIVANHKGVINIYSEKGRGATITFYLPASTKKDDRPKKGQTDDVMMGTETVLLVDDERMIRDVGGEMLREMGYQVYTAGSGFEALELYKQHSEEIDLVILDMIMPEMDGGKTYECLQELHTGIKVLLASGYSMTGQVTEILKRGFNGFIQKPFNMARLSRKIRKILEG